MKKNYKFKNDNFELNLPSSIKLGDVAGISLDEKDNIYLFNRGENPIIVINQKGELITTWGHGIFKNPHGAHIGHDQNIYLTDNGDHTLRKFTLNGKLLLQIGIPDTSPGFMSGKPFCKCTHSALTPEGNIIVSDGYGNASIHIFDPNGIQLEFTCRASDHDKIMAEDAAKAHQEIKDWTARTRELKINKFGEKSLTKR